MTVKHSKPNTSYTPQALSWEDQAIIASVGLPELNAV